MKLLLSIVLLLAPLATWASELPAPKPTPRISRDSRFYVKAYGFYGLLTPGSYRLPIEETSSSTTTNTTRSFGETKGLGGGLRVGGGVGFIVNDFLNVGLDGDYTLGNFISGEGQSKYSNSITDFNRRVDYTLISITPNVTFKAISTETMYVYNRLGVSVVLPQNFTQTYRSNTRNTTPASTATLSITNAYQASPGLGFQAALGLQASLGDNLRLFTEVVFNAYTFTPSESTYTTGYSYNGGTPSLNAPIKYLYQTEGTTTTPNPNPTQVRQLQQRFPINSLGLALGVAYRF